MQTKYGLLTYSDIDNFFNVGDYIQSLAAKQYLPQVDEHINREKLGLYDGGETKLIMNGWFAHNPKKWVPSDDIVPLFVSLHMNSQSAKSMLSENGIAYFKKHQPIGCRDQYTVDLLKEKGIEAYFTGCLTLTLDSYKVDDSERGDDVYIVNPLYNYPLKDIAFSSLKNMLKSIVKGEIFKLKKREKHLRKFVDNDLLKTAVYTKQYIHTENRYSDDDKLIMAEELLHKYARAKLVITSRIHCALPCLAMGTPVIFINGFDHIIDSCRFGGILDLFNRIDVNSKTGEFSANFPLNGKITKDIQIKNLEKHLPLAEALKEKCRQFIKKE